MFFLLLAGLISSLIHGAVKPQIRLHLWSCLAARLCLVPRPLLRTRQTVDGIIDNVLCYHPPAPSSPGPPASLLGPRRTSQWGPVRWVRCTNLSWSTAATATRLTSGNPVNKKTTVSHRIEKRSVCRSWCSSEVWKFNNPKRHWDADVEDSEPRLRQNRTKSCSSLFKVVN